ncbi:LOW QUALITY PROTEIN: hypothetical protein CFOL_v3_03738, partial [Cephalotus follicularis]
KRQRSQISASQTTAEMRFKLTTPVSPHEQMKIAYHQLKSEIKTGFLQVSHYLYFSLYTLNLSKYKCFCFSILETQEVFASPEIPLVKLVGLKTTEMANEGRFTAIIIFLVTLFIHYNEQECQCIIVISIWCLCWIVLVTNRQIFLFDTLQKESYASEAIIAGKEHMKNQQTQLMQLVHLLRQIETKVNSRQDDILGTLTNHRANLHNFFKKASYYTCNLHSQDHDTLLITLKLLQAIYDNVGAILGVEGGVQGLVQDLAAQMCDPMVEYVNGLKDDIKNGSCARLLALVEEMERTMLNGRLELAEVRKILRVAEEGRIEALCKLEEVRRQKEYLSL